MHVPALAASLLFLSTGPFAGHMAREGSTYHYDVYEVRYPSPVVSRFPPNNTVWGHLYVPRGLKSRPPCVLLLPVMAAPNLWIERRFVYELLWRRYAVFVVELPFQFHRVPARLALSGQVFLARRSDVLARNFAQAVLDARRAVEWLRSCPLVDGRRIALFGTSLGAMVGATTLSLESGLEGGVLLLGGADFPDLVFRGEMTRAFMAHAGISREELRRAWKGLDPLDFAGKNRGKRVFLVNARGDLVIPPENALKLKEAFPDARQSWLPLGHYTALLHMVWVPGYVTWLMTRIMP